MRRARRPTASHSGRSTRPPAIACAISWSMKRPARRSRRKTRAAATSSPGENTLSSQMRSSKQSRSRAPTPSRSIALCRARRSTSASLTLLIMSGPASRSDRRPLPSSVRPCAARAWWRSDGWCSPSASGSSRLRPTTRGCSARRCAIPMRSARPRITSAIYQTSPSRRTC